MRRVCRRATLHSALLVGLTLVLLATMVQPGLGSTRSRHVVRSYIGFSYLNTGVIGPGTNVDCKRGIGCVEVPLRGSDDWALFEVTDASGQAVSGWALGWTSERGWRVIYEFCGATDSSISVAGQEKLVLAFAVGARCAPDGALPTTGEVSFTLTPEFRYR